MIGYIAYQTHQAMNLHFSNADYDCFKYNFKTKANEDSFNRSRFKWQYVNLEKKCNNELIFVLFCVFKELGFKWTPEKTLIHQANKMIKNDMFSQKWLDNKFNNDLKYLSSEYKPEQLLECNGLYPNIYSEYKGGKVDLITLLLIDSYVKSFLNKDRSRDILAWPDFVSTCEKLIPFMEIMFDRVDIERRFINNYLAGHGV